MRLSSLIWLVAVALWASGSQAAAPDAGPPALARVLTVTPELRLNHIVDVRVEGLRRWSEQTAGSPWKLVPYIDGRALSGVTPVAVDLGAGTLQYLLVSNPANASTWTHLLSPLSFGRGVVFTVGLEHQDPLPTAIDHPDSGVRLIVVDRWWGAWSAGLVLVLGITFVRLAMRTSLLVDVLVDATGASTPRYSLAKVQFALWFFVIVSAFLVIWLTTGNFNSLNASVVAVLGISAGTAVGDSFLRRADGNAARLERTRAPELRHWRAFMNDLVCDAQGHSITRFQMLAWTVVLIMVFLVDVVDDLVMPVMGPELLYLLGLSSGTYVAHRRPEAPPAAGSGPGPGSTPDSAGPATRFGP